MQQHSSLQAPARVIPAGIISTTGKAQAILAWQKGQTLAEFLCDKFNILGELPEGSHPFEDKGKRYAWSDSLSLHICLDGSRFVYNKAASRERRFSASPDAICWGVGSEVRLVR